MIKSSKFLKYLGQYFFLVLAVSSIGNSLYYIFLGLTSEEWDKNEIEVGLIGLVFLVLYLYLKDKFVVVELGRQKIKIHNGKNTLETSWLNVESIDRLVFSRPPIYILRLNDIKGFFIFWNAELNLLWVDDSEMEELIGKKKKELDI